MIPITEAARSSIGQKILTSITGIGLALFVIIHLLGNLFLYLADGTVFNEYAHALASRKALVIGGDLVLLAGFVLHAGNSLFLVFKNRRARGPGYKAWKSKAQGLKTPSSRASRSMAITGTVLLLFIPFHVNHFKFGPAEAEGYVTTIGGEQARDLHRFVVETFSQPTYVLLYVIVMLMLWGHLKHGYWSFFQSMGFVTPRNYSALRYGGMGLATVLALGFLVIPILIYLRSLGVVS